MNYFIIWCALLGGEIQGCRFQKADCENIFNTQCQPCETDTYQTHCTDIAIKRGVQ